jgi:hypothetical protein
VGKGIYLKKRSSAPLAVDSDLPPPPLLIFLYYQNGTESFEDVYRPNPDIFDQLFKEGYQVEIGDLYSILKRRTLCLEADPDYAIRTTIDTIKTRYRQLLETLKTYPQEALTILFYQINRRLIDLIYWVRSISKEAKLLREYPIEYRQGEELYLYLLKNFPILIQLLEEELRRNP